MENINRRELFASAVAAVAARGLPKARSPVSHDRPWAKRADELWEREGIYCDYVAWREWFEREMSSDGFENPLDAYTPDEIHLYSLMCRLADGGPTE